MIISSAEWCSVKRLEINNRIQNSNNGCTCPERQIQPLFFIHALLTISLLDAMNLETQNFVYS